jgi:HAD superfamily phosphoserine phosphatase-like hydrolase
MDGTLIKERSVFVFSEILGFKDKLLSSINSKKKPYERTIEIAQFFKGIDQRRCLELFDTIPLQPHVESVASLLREKKIITAIATDSYLFLAKHLQQRLHFDYSYANNLIIEENIITGRIEIHNKKQTRCDNGKIYSICKEDVLKNLCKKLDITSDQVIAVGDGFVDTGMIKKAGLGIAFNAPEEVNNHADLCTNNLHDITQYL